MRACHHPWPLWQLLRQLLTLLLKAQLLLQVQQLLLCLGSGRHSLWWRCRTWPVELSSSLSLLPALSFSSSSKLRHMPFLLLLWWQMQLWMLLLLQLWMLQGGLGL